MVKNKPGKQDVLGTILQGTHSGRPPQGVEELTAMLARYSKPLIGGDVTPLDPASKKIKAKKHKTKKIHTKKKTTHYLTEDVYRELDIANIFLKGLLPTGSKLLSTKSKIVDYAVKMLLEDFESKKEESALVKKIITDK